MSKADVDELLKDIEEQLISIKKYKKITKVKLKSILENLRSSLEYMAQDINSALSKKRERVYFPYGDTIENFKKRINQNLPAIQSEYPALYDFIEHLQPHKNNGDKWLVDMCHMTNDAKHKGLLKVRNIGNDHVVIYAGGIPFIEVRNSGHGKVSLEVEGNQFLSENDDGSETNLGTMGKYHVEGTEVEVIEEDDCVSFSIVEEKKLVIDGETPIEAIPFLEKCFNKISQFSTDVYTQLK
jgi:hypothetical protein